MTIEQTTAAPMSSPRLQAHAAPASTERTAGEASVPDGPRPLAERAAALLAGTSPARLSDGVGTSTAGIEPTRRLVAEERGFDPSNPRYTEVADLALYRESDGSYVLEVRGRLNMYFRSEGAGDWSEREKQAYIADMRAAIDRVWDGHRLPIEGGPDVRLDMEIEIVDVPWRGPAAWLDLGPDAHWNVLVDRSDGHLLRSYVHADQQQRDHSLVHLESGDNDFREFGIVVTNDPDGTGMIEVPDRRFAVSPHEMGHALLGLPDEYANPRNDDDHRVPPGWSAPLSAEPYAGDEHSIMNHGSQVRDRHLLDLSAWVREQLPE